MFTASLANSSKPLSERFSHFKPLNLSDMNGKRIIIDGQEIWVPEGNVTGQKLRELAGASQEAVIYRVSPNGHEVIEDNQVVGIQEGEHFGTLERFVTGGRR